MLIFGQTSGGYRSLGLLNRKLDQVKHRHTQKEVRKKSLPHFPNLSCIFLLFVIIPFFVDRTRSIFCERAWAWLFVDCEFDQWASDKKLFLPLESLLSQFLCVCSAGPFHKIISVVGVTHWVVGCMPFLGASSPCSIYEYEAHQDEFVENLYCVTSVQPWSNRPEKRTLWFWVKNDPTNNAHDLGWMFEVA